MAVPTVITDMSATYASNSPAGGDSIGASLDDYLRAHAGSIRQLYDSSVVYSGTVGGTADVITLTPTVPVLAHKAGQSLAWIQSGANTTNVTVNPSGLGAKAVTKRGATALVAGDLPSGALVIAMYDGTQYQVLSVSPATFSDSQFRIQDNGDATKQLAFEVSGITTGTTRTVTLPDASFTMVGDTNTQTLANKALQDSTTTIVDDGDATKKLAFQCSSITTGTTRTVTIPDKSGTMAMTSDITSNATQTTSASPTAITSTTGKMIGLAAAITPTKSGNVLITVSGAILTTTGSSTLIIKTGTGAAPANGDAVTGTTRGIAVTNTWSGSAPNSNPPFAMTALVTGLSLATAIWIDLDALSPSGSVTLTGVCVTAVEL